jgi:two-component system chemotaxis sensor kinase CheA
VSDPELARLLLVEIARHLPALERDPIELDEARRALHALKGSLGLAGESALAQEVTRLERKLIGGDESAVRTAATILRRAEEKLLAGEPAAEGLAMWPVPPASLPGRAIEPSLRAQYLAEVGDRLAHIDEALGGALAPIEAITLAYRQVHTIKGAASSVGDEPMAWFCHGLEEQLRGGTASREAATAALTELAKWRGVLGGLLDDPQSALASLRPPEPRSSAPERRTSRPPDSEPAPRISMTDDATIRVAAQSVDRLLERTSTVAVAREAMAQSANALLERSAEMRSLRADLAEALRLIGPPRPWGAPAAALSRIRTVADSLAVTSERLEEASASARRPAVALREAENASKRELSAMRQTPLRQLFARLTVAVEAEARRSGRAVVVSEMGGDETVDRRLSEALLDPCLQIARNAVAHGIEPPDVRERAGKARTGAIRLSARKSAGRLRITIDDDGAGADVARVRERVVEAGMVSQGLAESADDDTLLALLFLPGFTTRDASDLLAGRGIGLDIALGAVQKLGGRVHLSSRRGEGMRASVEVPVESGFAKVLWVEAGGDTYALLAADVASVKRDGAAAPHLTACLGDRGDPNGAPGSVRLELAVEDDPSRRTAAVSVDAALAIEELLVRPLTPLVAAMGPFAGAIVRGDGTVRLALDAHALAPRARALAPSARNAGTAKVAPRGT